MNKKFTLSLIITLLYFTLQAQNAWVLKADRDGIKVFTKSQQGSKFKAIKVECSVQSTLSRLTYAIMDIATCREWVYSTKSCVMVKQVSASELYYYSEINVPWPVSNRDFVAHLVATQNPVTKVVTVDAENVAGLVPEKDNIVRVVQSVGKWVITPVGANSVKIEYSLFTDPGGVVPAWLINLFVTKGPFESFKKLKEHIQKPAFNNVHLNYVKD